MKVYCMCNRCVTLVKKKKHSRCFGGKNLLSSDSQMCFISIWTYGKALLPYEYRFLCFSFLYIYFYICTWLEFWKQKENLSPNFLSTLSSAVKTKLDLLVHFVNNQSVCVCVEIQFLRLSTFRSECHIVYRTWCRFLYTLYFLREELVLIVFTPNTAGRCQLFKHTSK